MLDALYPACESAVGSYIPLEELLPVETGVGNRAGSRDKIGITMDVYSHVLPSMQEEAAQRLNQALDPEYVVEKRDQNTASITGAESGVTGRKQSQSEASLQILLAFR